MSTKVKTGGRTKGTPNKKTQELIDKAKELGIDPYEILLFIAGNKWKELGYDEPTKLVPCGDGTMAVERIEMSHRLMAAKEACQYMFAKRKAVELSQDKDNPVFAPLTREEILGALKEDPFLNAQDE